MAAALPADCPVTRIGERALARADLVDACRAVGWDVVVRLRADARQGIPCGVPMAGWARSGSW